MLKPFRFWCQKVLPLVYDDSLSYYELLCKVVDYLNHLNEDVTSVIDLVESLHLDAIRAEVDAAIEAGKAECITAAEAAADAEIHELLDSGIVEDKIDELVENGYFDEIIRELARDWLYPEDYGAVGDGTTDDSDALRACFTAANTLRIPVRLKQNYFINSTVNVPSYVIVEGIAKTEFAPKIICGDNCNLAFNCTGIANTFESFIITNHENVYRNFNGIKFIGNFANDIDSVVKDVQLQYMDTAIEILGRNVDIIGGLISHVRIGVYFNVPDTQMRGLNVDGVRFHGVGEEAYIPWFNNSYAIYIEQNYYSNLTIRNCICDQSGTFFKGYATQALISNNYLECFKETPIDIGGDNTTSIGNTGTIIICDNYIQGKRGAVSESYTAPYPDYLVRVKNFTRCSFTGNTFRMCGKSAFKLINARAININANTFVGIGLDDAENYGVNMEGGSIVYFNGNVVTSSGTTLCVGTASDSIYFNDNIGFALTNNPVYQIGQADAFAIIGTGSSGTALSFSLPNQFYVRTGDGNTAWMCECLGSYVTGGFAMSADRAYLYVLQFTVSNGVYTPHYTAIKLSDMSSVNMGSTLTFYRKQN